jgi:hypothetical protein
LRRGLEQLSNEQLRRIIAYDGVMVLDEYNYYEPEGLY